MRRTLEVSQQRAPGGPAPRRSFRRLRPVTRDAWAGLLLLLHALGAIASLGPTLTYGMWVARGERAGLEARAFALRTISWIDRRMATPAYVLQALTGTVLIFVNRWRFLRTAWLLLGVGLYLVMVVFAVGLYAPTFRRQRTIAEELADRGEDPDLEARYLREAAAATRYGRTAAVLTVAIVALMVVKPALWSTG